MSKLFLLCQNSCYYYYFILTSFLHNSQVIMCFLFCKIQLYTSIWIAIPHHTGSPENHTDGRGYWKQINDSICIILVLVCPSADPGSCKDGWRGAARPQQPADTRWDTYTFCTHASLLWQPGQNDSLFPLYLSEREHAGLSISLSHLGILLTSDSSDIPVIPVHYKYPTSHLESFRLSGFTPYLTHLCRGKWGFFAWVHVR